MAWLLRLVIPVLIIEQTIDGNFCLSIFVDPGVYFIYAYLALFSSFTAFFPLGVSCWSSHIPFHHFIGKEGKKRINPPPKKKGKRVGVHRDI